MSEVAPMYGNIGKSFGLLIFYCLLGVTAIPINLAMIDVGRVGYYWPEASAMTTSFHDTVHQIGDVMITGISRFAIQRVDSRNQPAPMGEAEVAVLVGDVKRPSNWKLWAKMHPSADEPSKLVLPENVSLEPGSYILIETKMVDGHGESKYALINSPLEVKLDIEAGTPHVRILNGSITAKVLEDKPDVIQVRATDLRHIPSVERKSPLSQILVALVMPILAISLRRRPRPR